jgi:hypothetical protein
MDLGAIVDGQDRIDRHEVTGLDTVPHIDHFALGVPQGNAGTQIGAARLVFPVHDHLAGDTRRFIDRFTHRDAVLDIDVMGNTVLFGNDRDRIRVPVGNPLAAHHGFAIGDAQARTVWHPVTGPFPALVVPQDQFGIPAHDDRALVRIVHQVFVADRQGPVDARFDR